LHFGLESWLIALPALVPRFLGTDHFDWSIPSLAFGKAWDAKNQGNETHKLYSWFAEIVKQKSTSYTAGSLRGTSLGHPCSPAGFAPGVGVEESQEGCIMMYLA